MCADKNRVPLLIQDVSCTNGGCSINRIRTGGTDHSDFCARRVNPARDVGRGNGVGVMRRDTARIRGRGGRAGDGWSWCGV